MGSDYRSAWKDSDMVKLCHPEQQHNIERECQTVETKRMIDNGWEPFPRTHNEIIENEYISSLYTLKSAA